MKFPREMLSWKSGNLGLTFLGVWYMLLAFMSPNKYGVPGISTVANQGLFSFGIMFFSVALINAKSKPTVLGSLFAMLIGLSYFMGFMTTVNITILWTLSLALFAGTLVFEFDIFKFGPSGGKAKLLTIVPPAIIGFSLVLALFGYNPMVHFNWNYWMSALNLVAVTALCWLYVWDYVTPKRKQILGMTINTWLNLLAFLAVALSLLGVAQGSLFAWLATLV
jgi:hypothetical protein